MHVSYNGEACEGRCRPQPLLIVGVAVFVSSNFSAGFLIR